MSSDDISKIFEHISVAISSGAAEFFYDNRLKKKCCLIADVVLIFTEEEEGSFTMQYQNIFPMWIRETLGWEQLREALANVQEDEEIECAHVRRRVYQSLLKRLTSSK